MEQLIDFRAPEVQAVLPLLLEDKSTKRNLVWATDPPEALRDVADDKSEITIPQLQRMGYEAILPRMMKQADTQQERTRKKGEVFSPAWVCNKMNNALDADWFGPDAPKSLFTEELPQSWQTTTEPVLFDKSHKWEKYVDSRRLEVTCGEAPFLASRYDAATGELIPVGNRIGILDRKLRVVNENTSTEADWVKWSIRAIQSTYGYEWQGDNLLLARTNILLTFIEYLQDRWRRSPTTKELKTVANVIAWNLWQMDGLSLSIPGGKPQPETEQLDLFSMLGSAEEQPPAVSCKVKDWRRNKTQDFETIQEGSTSMKFDYVIGNPPYQDERQGTSNTATPVYHQFMDASYEVADKVLLITPARYLFNTGYTPKKWNQERLDDEHFKIEHYYADATEAFKGVDIKGGVAISYRDADKRFEPIQVFTPFPTLNKIFHKVIDRKDFASLCDIVVTSFAYHFTKTLYEENPELKGRASKGHDFDLQSNVFETLPEVFFGDKPDSDDYIRILGRIDNQRCWKYIKRRYVTKVENLDTYKLFLSKANGAGQFGETLPDGILGRPGDGATITFLSIGSFETAGEVEMCAKYLKTKFARALLGVLKATQNGSKPVFRMIPIQDFTSHSDIDWSRSIAEIDQQLYRKYGLTADEINFIETHVKEMA